MSRRRGLGRGLDALIEPERVVRSLPLSRLKPNRLQPRADFDEEGLAELASSIRAQGIVQPIVVTQEGDGGYLIVAGERRWRAARRAGLDEVPVVVREVANDQEEIGCENPWNCTRGLRLDRWLLGRRAARGSLVRAVDSAAGLARGGRAGGARRRGA